MSSYLEGLELPARQTHRRAVASDFALDLAVFELDAVDALARARVDSQHAACGQPVRDGHAAPTPLVLLPLPAHSSPSPNPPLIRRHSASSASRSSSPSAMMNSSVPREAASISTLRIDLASAEELRSARSRRTALRNTLAARTSFAAARACRPNWL